MSLSPTVGTRRLEELIREVRQRTYSEDYSLTEGWDDNVLANLFNLGLNKLYHKITEIDNAAHIEEIDIDVVATQQAYQIPIDVYMAIRLPDVRFLWGTQNYEFITLRQGMIQDRLDYPINVPDTFCIRDSQILLSPTPNISKAGALQVNYQKRMRTLDVRRGRVVSFTPGPPMTITLSFTPNSQKDLNLQQNAESMLDKIDYICLCDNFGNPLVTSIPVFNYNFTTQVITALQSYVIPASQQAALTAALAAAGTTVYPTQGFYSSTNSELDPVCEDFLTEFASKRLLYLMSNGPEATAQLQESEAILDLLVNAYRRQRPSVYPVRFVENFRNSSFPFSRRGIF